MVERGPEKAGVGGSIPSLATTTHAQPLPGFVSIENFNTTGNFENRAIGCGFRRKYKPIHIFVQRLPRNLYIPAQ